MDRNQSSLNRLGALLRSDQLAGEGLRLVRERRLPEAEAKFFAALQDDPQHFDALHNLGLVMLETGRAEQAIAHLKAARAQKPDAPEVYNNLAVAYCVQGRKAEAIAQYEEALRLNPNNKGTLARIVSLLYSEMRPLDALALLQWVVAQRPGCAFAHYSHANVLRTLGRFDEAVHAIEKALAAEPENGEYYYLLSDLKRFKPGDPRIAAMEDLSLRSMRMPQGERIALWFALAKAWRDIGENQKSFDLLLRANQALRGFIGYDENQMLGVLGRVQQAFTPQLMRSKAGQGDPAAAPLFILGMPRSGTTLVEQILASHPKVAGAGEITVVSDLVSSLIPDFPAGIADLGSEKLREFGARYMLGIGKLLGGVTRVTDKSLANPLFAGLIHLALPNARFIHVVRDPVDTCLSCFSLRFTEGQPFTHDLGELGRYHRAIGELIAYWESVFEPGTILRVNYEDLVADQEGQTRRMLAHAGLYWDEACLAFDKSERPVFTASATQVRQPIYSSSVGRWRPSPDLLKPLLDALDLNAASRRAS